MSQSNGKQRLSGVSKTFFEHNKFLKRFLSRFLYREQDIEDVAQETYLKAYSAEQEKGEIEQPKAFLFSIAKNIALNELNKKSRKMTSFIEDCQSEIDTEQGTNSIAKEISAEQQISAEQNLGLYCEAVAQLPEKTRQIYLLRKVHGLAQKEIAERLGISLSSVEKHLRMGVLHCRSYMNKQVKTEKHDITHITEQVVAMEKMK